MKWLFQGRDVNNDNTAVRTLQSLCSASVHFLAPHYIYKEINLFSCEVTKGHNLHMFPFFPQISGEKSSKNFMDFLNVKLMETIT